MGNDKHTVLVNGMGNIGTSLVNLLLHYRVILKIDNVYVAKRSIHPWNVVERSILEELGAIICTEKEDESYPQLNDILPKVHYIFEATTNGVGIKNRARYESLNNLLGCSAQGSEKHFGIPFMSGVNNEVILGQRFVNIVSCNTHGTASLLKTFCGDNLENLDYADVVVVRRSEDLGNHERLVSANVVARHLDLDIGTHHAIDVVDLFDTKGCSCKLTSSDITTPSQLMHSVRFNIRFKQKLNKPIADLIASNSFVATTAKFDSNVVFELGRRYGFNGRLYSHAIAITSNMLVDDLGVKGWAFVPQEGNSILSTIHAYLLQLKFPDSDIIFDQIKKDLLRSEW